MIIKYREREKVNKVNKNRQKGEFEEKRPSNSLFKGGQIERPYRSNLFLAITVINKEVIEIKRERK